MSTVMDGDEAEVSKNSENINWQSNIQKEVQNTISNNSLEYGLPLEEVYRLGLNFYKEKGGKAVHFSYEDNLQLVAFSQQVVHGPLCDVINKLTPLGTLDVVGKDRREAWQKLGKLSTEQARAGFIELLGRRCPLFSAFVEAHRREQLEHKQREKRELEQRLLEMEEQRKKDEEEKLRVEHLQKEEAIKRQIQQALNEQTYDQFRKYSEQQYPGDPEKQGTLIRQLQDQHYIQYMQQLQHAQQGSQGEKTEVVENNPNDYLGGSENLKESKDILQEDDDVTTIVAASMWTLPDIEAFKQRVSQNEGDGVVRVGHGETVTVRVPTHPNGSRLFWEFATDHYDIGFGIYFEFGNPMTEEVSVHVSESDGDDLDEIDEEELYNDVALKNDLEAAAIDLSTLTKPLLTEIVPVYRRDCQNEVYAGSHLYPGKGVYLLKFDNSYSLWRSKTLYYRVYYTH
ncbi:Golgi resident protein GCP60 [Cylas formicarius]|uniref:Golgi resident protein GCP60 n=1 Tax=Cylas formicarius TaxID=197179 RepID=UPI002958422A|nr:Golgi resident protein GCP60 [Cylas formicarius]